MVQQPGLGVNPLDRDIRCPARLPYTRLRLAMDRCDPVPAGPGNRRLPARVRRGTAAELDALPDTGPNKT